MRMRYIGGGSVWRLKMTLKEMVHTLSNNQNAFMLYVDEKPTPESNTLQRFYWYEKREKVIGGVFEQIVYSLIPEAERWQYCQTIGQKIYSEIGDKIKEEKISILESILSGEKFPNAEGENLDKQQQDYLLYFGSLYFIHDIKSTAADILFSYQHNAYLIVPKMEELFELLLQQRAVRCLASLQDRMIERIKEVKEWT